MTDQRRIKLGAIGEQLAAEHLTRLGLQILDRNFRTRFGELDLVACDGRAIVFCEVKTRQSLAVGRDPLESVHARKRIKVRRMAGQWLATRQDRPRAQDLRFDAIGITLSANGKLVRLDHVEAAF